MKRSFFQINFIFAFLIFILPSLSFLFNACASKVEKHEKQIKYFCPMHPSYTSNRPGQCPICGMNLVPQEKEEGEIKKSSFPERVSVHILPHIQQIIGVKSEMVEKKRLIKKIKTVGKVDFPEKNVFFLNAKFEGWIEKLYFNYLGQFVRKGEPVVEIYSPELLATQKEYLAQLRSRKIFGESELFSSNVIKQRLKLWDITDEEIKLLEERGEFKKRLTLHSPYTGFIIEKYVIEGQKIMPGENMFKIADLSTVWIYGEIYEFEVPLIKRGQKVKITLPYIPGKTFYGEISYIYPFLSHETRTNKIRVEVENPEFELKPGMYANLEIEVDLGEKLVIPKDSVLHAGEKKYIFVGRGDGTFEPRIVNLGVRTDEFYEVIEGVEEGEKVVTSGTFLIDSESSLSSALRQMKDSGESHTAH